MKELDVRTVEGIAGIIEGQYGYLKFGSYREMTKFLVRAGVTLPDLPDILNRVAGPGAAVVILRIIDGTADFERVLLRLASPVEYAGDRAGHDYILRAINRILWAEDLKIELDGPHPRIGALRDYEQCQSQSEIRSDQEHKMGNAIFVVHGRDTGRRDTLVRFLKEDLQLETLVLQEQADSGRTVIEKFEIYAAQAGFAVALLTPDDVGSLGSSPESTQSRARQNVIFELGYFIGKLGRSRVRALKVGEVEMLSDYEGVIYTTMDDTGGWQQELRREIQNAGLL